MTNGGCTERFGFGCRGKGRDTGTVGNATDPELRPGFWEFIPLEDLNAAEWEALCDGCGKCCLLKLQDEVTDAVHYSSVFCRLFDPHLCRCGDYKHRQQRVKECVVLTPQTIAESADWMPRSCAYRLRHEGKPLPAWHHLVSGDSESIHRQGMSLRGKSIRSEAGVPDSRLEEHLLDDPLAGTLR